MERTTRSVSLWSRECSDLRRDRASRNENTHTSNREYTSIGRSFVKVWRSRGGRKLQLGSEDSAPEQRGLTFHMPASKSQSYVSMSPLRRGQRQAESGRGCTNFAQRWGVDTSKGREKERERRMVTRRPESVSPVQLHRCSASRCF